MGAFGGPDIITDGLVFAVNAASTRSYPGSGNTWYNLSGENNGTLVNNPTFNSNGWFDFDGVDDHVSMSVSSTYMTLAFWIKIDDTSDTAGIADGSGYGNLDLYNNTSGKYYIYTTNTDGARTILISSTSVVQSDWYYLVVVLGSGQRKIYQNNVLVASDTKTARPDTIFDIGQRDVYKLEGSISSFNMYNRALTTAEISQNYNAQKNRFI